MLKLLEYDIEFRLELCVWKQVLMNFYFAIWNHVVSECIIKLKSIGCQKWQSKIQYAQTAVNIFQYLLSLLLLPVAACQLARACAA